MPGERKNPEQYQPQRGEGVDKVAIRRTGRQYYLDPDLQRRYDGVDKVARTERVAPVPRGDLKAAFVRPRAPRPRHLDQIDRLDLPPMEPVVVGGVPADPRLTVDPDAFAGEAGLMDSEGYVRMRVLVQGDSLTVLDSHLVDGPLREGASFPGGFAYDVTVGEELLHAGPVPDLGVRRSFIDPDGPTDERFHHLTEATTNVFTVRVPAELVTPDRLRRIEVRLYRLKDEAVATRATREPVSRRFEQEVRVVAARTGLPRSVLPAEIRRRGGVTGQG